MATAKKKSMKAGSRKPAGRAKSARKSAAKAGKSEVVYSDVRRDALAWQISRLR